MTEQKFNNLSEEGSFNLPSTWYFDSKKWRNDNSIVFLVSAVSKNFKNIFSHSIVTFLTFCSFHEYSKYRNLSQIFSNYFLLSCSVLRSAELLWCGVSAEFRFRTTERTAKFQSAKCLFLFCQGEYREHGTRRQRLSNRLA